MSSSVRSHEPIKRHVFSRMRRAGGADPQWISLATACRILNRDPGTVKSILLANRVRVQAIRGTRVRFAREDVVRALQA